MVIRKYDTNGGLGGGGGGRGTTHTLRLTKMFKIRNNMPYLSPTKQK